MGELLKKLDVRHCGGLCLMLDLAEDCFLQHFFFRLFVFQAINLLHHRHVIFSADIRRSAIVRRKIMTFDWTLLPNFLYPKTVIKFG